MPALSAKAEAVIMEFGQQPGVNQEHLNNLRAAFNNSPALTDQINCAVEQGHLRAIVPLSNPNAGGQYDPKDRAMQLPLAKLTTPPVGSHQHRIAMENAGEITFVLGHELQHGLNQAATRQAYTDFVSNARDIAKNDSPPRDYTVPTAALLAQNRSDEAGAEIAGWNAIVSRVKSTNPNPSLQDIYAAQPRRMVDFIAVSKTPPITYTLKPNLTINPDLTLNATPANVEAMGKNYFDKQAKAFGGPVGLGHHGNSDYINYYGASAVSFIAKTERHYHPPQPGVTAPQMSLNLSQLRLDEKLLEENGIHLGSNPLPIPYLDSSTNPPKAGLFQHTANTHAHVNPIFAQLDEARTETDARHIPGIDTARDPLIERYFTALQAGDDDGARTAAIAFATSERGQRIFVDAEQRILARQQQMPGRDHPLFAQALGHLERLGPDAGGYLDRVEMERIAGTVAHQAQVNRMPAIDALAPIEDGRTLRAIWEHPRNELAGTRIYIDRGDAASQPLDRSLHQLVTETREQEAQAQLLARQQNAAQHMGFSR